MKLLYVSTNPFPSRYANTVNTIKMCQAFEASGVKVELVCMSSKKPKDIFDFYGVNPFSLKIIPETSKFNYLFRLFLLFVLKKKGLISLYTRSPVIAGLGLFFFDNIAYESHLIPSDFMNSIAERFILGKSKIKLICISNILKQDYLELYPKRKLDILVAHDGADLNHKLNEIRPSVRTLGYIGQLYKGKGIDVALNLAKLCPHFEFIILGGTEQEILDLKSQHGELPNVTFKGHVPHSEIPTWASSFDIALAPLQKKNIISDGKTDIGRWTSPLKIFEYIAMGIPMISSDLDVIREIVKSGTEAYLCSPDDLTSWLKALEELKPQEIRKKMSESAYERLKTEFTWTIRANNIIAFIKR